MFNFGRLKHLSNCISVDESTIHGVLDDFDTNPESVVKELTLWPIDKTKKPRDVICVRGNFRLIQQRLYTRLFLKHFSASYFSHGATKKRNTATNARAHIGNDFAFVTDIAGFFPAISCSRVNQLFLRFGCSHEVAGILTRLCTYDFHLALGLTTSPIIANQLFKPIDYHIGKFCKDRDLTYTRFVDDLTISGKYDLETLQIGNEISNIVERNGFKLAKGKTDYGRFDKDIVVTGVRVKSNRIDASKQFINELNRLIDDHTELSQDRDFQGPLLMESELYGKAHFACSINPGRRHSVLGKLKKIQWDALMKNAVERELVRHRKRITERGVERPDSAEELPLVTASKAFKMKYGNAIHDSQTAPF